MPIVSVAFLTNLLAKLESLGGEIQYSTADYDGSLIIKVNHPDVTIKRRTGDDTVEILCRKGFFPPTRAHVDVDDIITVISGWMKEAGSKCNKPALMTPTKESEAFESAFNEENELARETAAENADYGLGREITEAVRQRKANERAATLKRKRREWGVDKPSIVEASYQHHRRMDRETAPPSHRWQVRCPQAHAFAGYALLEDAEAHIRDLKLNTYVTHIELEDTREPAREWYYDKLNGRWRKTAM